MLIEAAAGLAPPADARRAARVLVFDSGLGGLTVLREVAEAVPGCAISYLADDAVFPYGRLVEDVLVARVETVLAEAIAREVPDVVVIACNTASTAVLGPLRARWPGIAFVGTVPAVKPAAALSRSGLVSVLATPGTVARDYTRDLVLRFAGGCAVTLVGAPRLAALTEAALRGEAVDAAAVAAEIAPAFVEQDGRRTDAVVLACTHYPLLLDRFAVLAPWAVTWVDPAPAIARRVAQVLRDGGRAPDGSAATGPVPVTFTSGTVPGRALDAVLNGRGIAWAPRGEHP